MEVNFVESNPIPVKAAMALMGLLEPVWRLPLVPPQPHNLARIEKVLKAWISLGRCPCCRLKSSGSSTNRRILSGRAFRAVQPLQGGSERGPGARRRAGRLPDQRLARERLGEEGHPARLPHGRHRRHVDRPRPPAVLRQVHLPGEALRRDRRACASCPAARASATAATSAKASPACRRCTSTPARTSATAP